jgi:predicted dehydrogenase
MTSLSRRRFLKTAAAVSSTFPLFTIAGTQASGRVIGANDTVRIGIVGTGSRGSGHIGEYLKIDNVQISHLVDPDSSRVRSQAKRIEDKSGKTPNVYSDMRRAFDDKDLDAVSVATCNHWHSLTTVWACQAGKDVYVEKPISHNVFEGRQCVKAAEKYDRIVQHGTQQRSSLSRAKEMAAVKSGKYGKLLVSKGYCCKPRWSIGIKEVTPPPSGFDFNVWLGPAPEQPFHGNLHPYNWHWFWDFGNGDIGNQGVHEMDVARWGIDGATLPTKVWSLGGRFLPKGEKDQGQTPNMELSVMEFGDVLLVFETRGLVGKEGAPSRRVENEFYTTEGVIRGGKLYPNNGGDAVRVEGEATVAPDGPFGSFIAAVRSRDKSMVNGDVETAHYSAALCHLGNISYRLGKPVSFDGRPSLLGDNAQVIEAFNNVVENLQAVDVVMDDTATYQLGPVLSFDPASEQFVDNDEANQLLTRPYRAPFIVPENV